MKHVLIFLLICILGCKSLKTHNSKGNSNIYQQINYICDFVLDRLDTSSIESEKRFIRKLLLDYNELDSNITYLLTKKVQGERFGLYESTKVYNTSKELIKEIFWNRSFSPNKKYEYSFLNGELKEKKYDFYLDQGFELIDSNIIRKTSVAYLYKCP